MESRGDKVDNRVLVSINILPSIILYFLILEMDVDLPHWLSLIF